MNAFSRGNELQQQLSDGAEVKVKKSRKSKNNSSPYWVWFMEVGRVQFRRRYGRDYNHECDDDRALITELWEPVKEKWDKRVKSGENLRSLALESGAERNANISVIRRRSADRRPSNFPLPVRTCESIELFNVQSRRDDGKRDLLDRLKFFDAQKVDFSSVVLQFITVYPYTVAFSTCGDFLVYPAEIAVTHFTLAGGTSSCWSKLISFNPNIFYGRGIPSWDQQNIERNALSLDVSLKEPVGVAPSEVWRMLLERRSSRAVTVCDARQLMVVDRALFFLASTAGESELPIYKDIMQSMVTAQDLVAVLTIYKASKEKTVIPENLTGPSIDQEFKRLRETSRCCRYHGSRPPNHKSRQNCALAKTDIMIDTICSLCFAGDLENFRALYNPNVHLAGVVDVAVTDDVEGPSSIKKSTALVSAYDDSSDEESEGSPRGFMLNYRVVKTVPESSEQRRVEVDLTAAISNLLKEVTNTSDDRRFI